MKKVATSMGDMKARGCYVKDTCYVKSGGCYVKDPCYVKSGGCYVKRAQ